MGSPHSRSDLKKRSELWRLSGHNDVGGREWEVIGVVIMVVVLLSTSKVAGLARSKEIKGWLGSGLGIWVFEVGIQCRR